MFNFFQSTPRYNGEGQPTADCGGGLLGMLGLLGGFFPRAPEYKSPPVNGKAPQAELPPKSEPEPAPEPDVPTEPAPIEIEGPDPEQKGPVMIVITPPART